MKKLSKRPPEWHAKIAEELKREFAETHELSEQARMRRIRLGLMFLFVKEMGRLDGSIPHGQFGPWLELNAKGIPRRTAGDYITEAKSLSELLRWENGEIRHFETPPHRLLALKNDDGLSAHDKKARADMLKVVDQESHFRAVTRYRQVELKDDATVEKAGRRKGEGGATKEQRAKAAAEAEEKRVESIKLKAEQFADWLDDVADAKGLGQINGTSEFSKLFKSTEHAVAFMRRIAGSKGGEQ